MRVRRAQLVSTPEGARVLTESAELKRLKVEVRELRRASKTCEAAVGFLAAELDRPERTGEVHG